MTIEMVSLSDIAEVRLGRQRSPKNHDGPNNRKYVRAANVGWDGLILNDVKVMNFSDAEMAIYRLEPGDLLLNEASGSATEVGKAAVWMGEIGDCAFQNTLLRVRPGFKADSRYLLHYLRQQASSGAFARGSRGVGIYHLGREALAKWPVPLPSIANQRRIVAILDQAEELLAKRRHTVAMLDSLCQSIFIDMFGDPDEAMDHGNVMKFGDIADLEGGRNLVAEDQSAESEFRVLKISSVTSGIFKPYEAKPLPAGYAPPAKHFVRRQDLLISRANTAQLVGAVAYVNNEPRNLVLPDKIWRFVWHDPASEPLYYRSLFRCESVRHRLSQLSSGTGGSMKNISKAKLNDLLLPDVATGRQHEFARRISAIPEATVSDFDDLFRSLQFRAFSGQL